MCLISSFLLLTQPKILNIIIFPSLNMVKPIQKSTSCSFFLEIPPFCSLCIKWCVDFPSLSWVSPLLWPMLNSVFRVPRPHCFPVPFLDIHILGFFLRACIREEKLRKLSMAELFILLLGWAGSWSGYKNSHFPQNLESNWAYSSSFQNHPWGACCHFGCWPVFSCWNSVGSPVYAQGTEISWWCDVYFLLLLFRKADMPFKSGNIFWAWYFF